MIFVIERQLLKKSYNVLIMFLAISDVLTAVNIIMSPFYVLGNAFPYPENPIPQEIFCRFIYNKILVFQLIYFSVYITLVLTAERWFAVVRPHQYNHAFSRKRSLATLHCHGCGRYLSSFSSYAHVFIMGYVAVL